MVMFLHTAYNPLYTCQEQALNSSHSPERVHVPPSKVNGSLVQMFRVFFPFRLLRYVPQQFTYHKLIDTQTSGAALYLATHSSTELKKKERKEKVLRMKRTVLSHFNLPRYLLDKCLPSSLAVCSFLALVRLEEFVYGGITSFGVSCLSS